MAEIIQETLSDFDIPVEIVNIETGPTITQFGVQPLYVERAGTKAQGTGQPNCCGSRRSGAGPRCACYPN